MTSKYQKATSIVILLVVCVISLLPVNADSMSAGVEATRKIGPQFLPGALLIAPRNRPILVNEIELPTDGTVLRGATLETKGDGATVRLASLWILDLAPETKLTLDFADSTVTVMLSHGHAVLEAKKGITTTFNTRSGQAAVSDPRGDSVLDVSLQPGALTPTVSKRAGVGTDAEEASAEAS